MDGCWKSCHVEASDKITLMREVHFLLKSGFQVITFSILLEVGYLIKIVGNFIYKWAQNIWMYVKMRKGGKVWNF